MSTAAEIERAIRKLPADEARAVANWLQEYLVREVGPSPPPAGNVFAKWRGRGRLPVGHNAEEYLQLTRDGNGS